MALHDPLFSCFCVQPRRKERKERKRKEELARATQAETHIWVIRDDRPRIIPPNDRRQSRLRVGVAHTPFGLECDQAHLHVEKMKTPF